MKKIFLYIFTSLLIVSHTFALEEFPQPKGLVNDVAEVFPADYRMKLSLILQIFRDKLGVEMTVATVPTIGDYSIDDYATRLYEKWGIGKKGVDEGLLILIAKNERKIRIEVGYGLEGILPDGKVGRILDEQVIPYLKENNYSQGVGSAVVALSEIIAKEKNISLKDLGIERKPKKKTKPFGIFGILFLLLMLLFIGRRGGLLPMLLFASMMGGRRGFGGFGGGFGSGGFSGFGGGLSGGGGASRGF